MTTTTRLRCSAALICALLLATACASSRKPAQPTLTISTGDSSSISFTFSPELARAALEGALGTRLDCNGELDPEVASVLRSLQRDRSGRVSRRDGDGRLVARRRGNTLRLQLEGRASEGAIEATMPWAVAECLLGRDMTLAEALGHGKQRIMVKVTGENGESFEVSLDEPTCRNAGAGTRPGG